MSDCGNRRGNILWSSILCRPHCRCQWWHADGTRQANINIIAACSRNHCCHRKSTTHTIRIYDLHIADNNIKCTVLLWKIKYGPLCTVVQLHNILLSSCTIFCCPATRYFVVQLHDILLSSCAIFCCPGTQYFVVQLRNILLSRYSIFCVQLRNILLSRYSIFCCPTAQYFVVQLHDIVLSSYTILCCPAASRTHILGVQI